MYIYIYIHLLISRTCLLFFCIPYITWYMEMCIHSQVEVMCINLSKNRYKHSHIHMNTRSTDLHTRWLRARRSFVRHWIQNAVGDERLYTHNYDELLVYVCLHLIISICLCIQILIYSFMCSLTLLFACFHIYLPLYSALLADLSIYFHHSLCTALSIYLRIYVSGTQKKEHFSPFK